MSLLSPNNIYTATSNTASSYQVPSAPTLIFSAAVCSPAQPFPVLTLSNTTYTQNLPFDADGLVVLTEPFPSGGSFNFSIQPNAVFEFALSDTAHPIHETLPDDNLPVFGDSSATEAILFSHTFEPPPNIPPPTYPNYTLPVDFPDLQPTTQPNLTLVLAPTNDTSFPPAVRTGCSLLQTHSSSGTILNQSFWLRDDAGWRAQFVVGSLAPSTNYTAFFVQDGTRVSGPIFFTTKSASFPCTLAHSLPYCPAVAYAVPLPPPPSSSQQTYDGTTIPQDISSALTSSLANLTISLTSTACGRDLYSPLVTCRDCQRAYRNWLCAVSFPRCAEHPPTASTTTTTTDDSDNNQAPLLGVAAASPALVDVPPSATPRNPTFPVFAAGYTAVLPCLEVCTLADRACPNVLGFRCPRAKFGAGMSYGVGFIDDGERGDQGGGSVGVTQDRWGNVWCNGLGVENFTFDFLQG